MKRKKIITCFAACTLLLYSGYRAKAQPFSLDDSIQPVELTLVDYMKEDTLKRGRINISEVTQQKDTMYFFVKGLSIYSPVYFSITASGSTGNIKVNLDKDNWHKVEQTGETGNSGKWDTHFKTEGDFGIQVIVEKTPVDYVLLVWTGDEAKDVGMPSVFKGAKGSGSGKSSGFFKKNILYIIIGVLVIALAVVLLKRKRS